MVGRYDLNTFGFDSLPPPLPPAVAAFSLLVHPFFGSVFCARRILSDGDIPVHSAQQVPYSGTVPHHRSAVDGHALAAGIANLVRYEHHRVPRYPGTFAVIDLVVGTRFATVELALRRFLFVLLGVKVFSRSEGELVLLCHLVVTQLPLSAVENVIIHHG